MSFILLHVYTIYKIIFVFGVKIHAENINAGPLITLTGRKTEESDFTVYELNCSSVRQPLDNSAEFIFNSRTVEHISVYDDKCFNSEEKECNVNLGTNCDCVPNRNIYIFKIKGENNDGNIFTCQMRFNDDSNANIIKAFVSIKFHGSEVVVYEYDAKNVGKEKGDNKTIKNAADSRNLEMWLPVGLCAIIVVVIGTLSFCAFRKQKCSKTDCAELTPLTDEAVRRANIDKNHSPYIVAGFLAICFIVSFSANLILVYMYQNIESHPESTTLIPRNTYIHKDYDGGFYLAAENDKTYLSILATNITLEVVKYAEVNVILCKEEKYIITCNKHLTENCIVLSSGKLHNVILEERRVRYLIDMQCIDGKLVGLKWTYHFGGDCSVS